MQAALLPDRGVVQVAGETARDFLNGLLTSDIGKISPGAALFAALLTPQGKIIADGIVAQAPEADGGGFYLDCPRALAKTLAERLNFYKLRAPIAIADVSEDFAVLALWSGAPAQTAPGIIYPDPRLAALGFRAIVPRRQMAEVLKRLRAGLVDAAEYERHRIALGVPRGGLDFAYGDAFPHEADMDQLGGVDFSKGCYVGQEVVSRIEHRGIARTRVVPVAYDGAAPEPGIEITAGNRALGVMGSASGGLGLALLRLDRVGEALAAKTPLSAGGIAVRLRKTDWMRFDLPDADKAAS